MESRNSFLEWRDFCCSSSSSGCSNTNDFCESAMDGFGKLSSYRGSMLFDDVMGLTTRSSTLSPSEPLTGLRLGRHREYGDDHSFPQPTTAAAGTPVKDSPAASLPVSATALPTAKRSRTSYQNMQNPCCQVEGCNLDLKLAKDYHRRHRICETHSKSPKVIVAGMERRFCQQCSRFHELSEFDDKKRSCRRRLSDHNARRRRVQPESIHFSPSPSLSSSPAVYGVSNSYERSQNILLNGLPISLSQSSYGGTPPCFSTSVADLQIEQERLPSISMHASNPEKLLQITNEWNTTDLVSVHSLLSSNTWSLNEVESSSMAATIMNTNENYDSVSPLQPINNSHLFYDSGRFL